MSLSRVTRAIPSTALLRRSLFPSITRFNNVPCAYLATSTGSESITDVVKRDHRELEDYYNRILNSNDQDEQVRYQNQFIWELARHSIGEELVVYPEMEKISGGKEIADKDRQAHQKATPPRDPPMPSNTNTKPGQRTALSIPKTQTCRRAIPPRAQNPHERPLAAHCRRRTRRPTRPRGQHE